MKNKDKNRLWAGFFTNMLGIILGIMLTFGVNALWQKHEDNKKINEIMSLLRHELEINKEWFKTQEKLIRADCYVYKKILEANGDWKSIHPDTLKQYQAQTSILWRAPFTSSAWQMFQNSDVIQKMNSQKLVIGILNAYTVMDLLKELIMTEYWDEKKKVISMEEDPYKYFDDVINNKTSTFFYRAYTSEESPFWHIFELTDEGFGYLLPLLDEHGYYLHNVGEEEQNGN
jgi:hypothetical protein